MPQFPVLKTGAAAQYPLGRTVRFQTHTVRFLDGSRQQYPCQGSGLRHWTIRLDRLDDQELTAVREFVELHGSAVFAFVDPVTGDSAAKCVIANESMDIVINEEANGQASLVIREVL